MILTHLVPDLAKWQIRVGRVMLFGASERPLNHPGDDLVDPIVPIPEDGAHWDGQNPSFPNSILAGVLIEQKRSGERGWVKWGPTGGGAEVEERVHARPLWFWPPSR